MCSVCQRSRQWQSKIVQHLNPYQWCLDKICTSRIESNNAVCLKHDSCCLKSNGKLIAYYWLQVNVIWINHTEPVFGRACSQVQTKMRICHPIVLCVRVSCFCASCRSNESIHLPIIMCWAVPPLSSVRDRKKSFSAVYLFPKQILYFNHTRNCSMKPNAVTSNNIETPTCSTVSCWIPAWNT